MLAVNNYTPESLEAMYNDERLDFKTKGILTYLCMQGTGEEVTVEDLMKVSTNGTVAVHNALKEAEEHGYLIRERLRDNGRLRGHKWIVEL